MHQTTPEPISVHGGGCRLCHQRHGKQHGNRGREQSQKGAEAKCPLAGFASSGCAGGNGFCRVLIGSRQKDVIAGSANGGGQGGQIDTGHRAEVGRVSQQIDAGVFYTGNPGKGAFERAPGRPRSSCRQCGGTARRSVAKAAARERHHWARQGHPRALYLGRALGSRLRAGDTGREAGLRKRGEQRFRSVGGGDPGSPDGHTVRVGGREDRSASG